MLNTSARALDAGINQQAAWMAKMDLLFPNIRALPIGLAPEQPARPQIARSKRMRKSLEFLVIPAASILSAFEVKFLHRLRQDIKKKISL
jgi:hypothetical protein